jgi:hypothetical protein
MTAKVIIPLNITTVNCLPQWKLKDAINEFLSNALDEEAVGTKVQDVLRIEGRQVIITNRTTRKVEPRHFLQGGSYKTKHEKFGGGYGAGMKDAIGVCAYNNVQVTLRSGTHIYRSEVTQDMKVVVEDETDPRGDPHTVTVVLQSDLDWPALERAAKGLLELHRQIGSQVSSPSDEGTWHMFNNNNSSSNVAVLIRGVHFCFFKDLKLSQRLHLRCELAGSNICANHRPRPALLDHRRARKPSGESPANSRVLQCFLGKPLAIQAYLDRKASNESNAVQQSANPGISTAALHRRELQEPLPPRQDAVRATRSIGQPTKSRKKKAVRRRLSSTATASSRIATNLSAQFVEDCVTRLLQQRPPPPPADASTASPAFLKLREKYDEVSKVALRLIVQNPPIIVDKQQFNATGLEPRRCHRLRNSRSRRYVINS